MTPYFILEGNVIVLPATIVVREASFVSRDRIVSVMFARYASRFTLHGFAEKGGNAAGGLCHQPASCREIRNE